MKMIYNGTPMKSLNIKHFEMDTNSATVVPSDLQAGVTCYARGQKVTGTGKCFEFAMYGSMTTNTSRYIPTSINVIEICSMEHPIKLTVALNEMYNMDFSSSQHIANVNVDGINYPLNVSVINNILKITCDKTFLIEVFYGKDNYV